MKEIKCTSNPNGYNITVGNTYNMHDESEDFYFIVNDNNKMVKYGKTMFQDIEEEVVPEPVKRTEQDMIDSIVWNNDGTIQFNDLDNNTKSFGHGFHEEGRLEISCGIREVTSLNDTINEINSAVPQDDDYLNLRKELLKKIIQKRIIEGIGGSDCAMRVLSTNLDYDPDILAVLDEMADLTTEARNNPNSGNMIKMWIFHV